MVLFFDSLENEKQAGLTDEHTFKPKLNSKIPDFKFQQEKFEKMLSITKTERPSTSAAPFPGLEHHSKVGMEKKKLAHKKFLENELERMKFEKSTLDAKILKAFTPPKVTKGCKLLMEHRKILREADDLVEKMENARKQKDEERKRMAALKIRARIDQKHADLQKENNEVRKKRFAEGKRI